jgi:hypothetical protein
MDLSANCTCKRSEEGRKAAVGPQARQPDDGKKADLGKRDEGHRRAVQAGALFQSVREQMQGKSSRDFPAVLSSVFHRQLTGEELSELGYKPDANPEELIKQLWYALVFEAYFAGHPRAKLRVHLLPRPETPNFYPVEQESGRTEQSPVPYGAGVART